MNFYVVPECQYCTKELWCKRADKNGKHYSCNEIWCEIKIRKEEVNKNEMV
ncbi:MAG: hypothetical protein GF317_20805 [Candidatus Lokiarchaeota archaeon]|nr:hypothetical protein [Candidatus Lokiarchaeota archaeon]